MNLDQVITERKSKTLYRDGDKTIKLFHDQYTKVDVLTEALIQVRVEQTGLNIPKVLEVTMVNGEWAIISEYIEGDLLADLIAQNPRKKDRYLKLMVDIQNEIHTKKCPRIDKLRDKMNRKVTVADIEPNVRYDLHTVIEGMPKRKEVCHGNFDPTKVIITADGTPYVVGWKHASQGCPAGDAATTYMLLRLSYDQKFADRYLELFCKTSGIAKTEVQRWLPIVAAARSISCTEAEKELLMPWINVEEIV